MCRQRRPSGADVGRRLRDYDAGATAVPRFNSDEAFGRDQYALRRDDQGTTRGHEFDLQDLADWLPSGNIHVTKDDVGYYLSAAVIDNPPEGKTFYEAAQDLLPIVNGIGSLKSAKFRPVKLDGRYQDGTLTMACAGRASQGCERLKINRVVHIMATVQLRNPTEGRATTTAQE